MYISANLHCSPNLSTPLIVSNSNVETRLPMSATSTISGMLRMVEVLLLSSCPLARFRALPIIEDCSCKGSGNMWTCDRYHKCCHNCRAFVRTQGLLALTVANERRMNN